MAKVRIAPIYFKVAFILWTFLTSYLLLVPDTKVITKEVHFDGLDKVAHLILFFVWSFLFYLSSSFQGRKRILFALALAILFGIISESIQSYLPQRSGELLDFGMDLIGAALGMSSAYLVKKELIEVEKELL